VFESCTKCNIKKIEFRKLVLIIVLSITGVLVFSNCSYAQTSKTVPDSPTGFTATAISPTSISLSWSPPQNNGGAAITGYKIEYKVPPSDYSVLTNTGNVTQYTHTGLLTGKTYIYRVSAINSVGTSNPSLESVVTPKNTSAPPLNKPPNPPSSLTAVAYSGTQINLSWTSPTSNGGPPVTAYKIQYKLDSANFTNLVSNTGTSDTSYYHSGLTTGHTYTYRVFAINSVGTSNSSNTATAIPIQINTAPNAPTGLGAFPASASSISLSWVPPQNSGGSVIIGYKIEYKTSSGTWSVLAANTGSTATSYIHKGLITGTTYTYRVSSINCIGMGAPSNEASAAPTKTFIPTGVTAVAVSSSQINLSWVPPTETYGQVIIGYKIEKKFSTGALDTIVDNTGPTTSYLIANLVAGKTYTFVITALFSGGGESPPSHEISAIPTSTSTQTSVQSSPLSLSPQCASPPDPPTRLNATAASQTSAKLSWIPPSNNGKPSVTGYKIEYKTSSGSWSVLTANAGNITSYIHGGLNADTYTYRISAINSIGTSTKSNEASITLSAQSSTPTPPQTPTVPEISGGTIVVTDTDFLIGYNAVGGKVLSTSVDKDTFSLHMKMEAKSDGVLFIQLPRELIDSKKADGSDDVYYVLADKNTVKFNETRAATYRTLAITFPSQTNEIAIYGTHVVPEFGGLVVLILLASFGMVLTLSKTKKLQFKF